MTDKSYLDAARDNYEGIGVSPARIAELKLSAAQTCALISIAESLAKIAERPEIQIINRADVDETHIAEVARLIRQEFGGV